MTENVHPTAINSIVVPEDNEIVFSFGDANWIMKFTSEGVRFNHKAFPGLINDEDEKAITNILEKRLGVTFNKSDKD